MIPPGVGPQPFALGVRPGDLLGATEGGARTDAIACGSSCRVRYVADGPADALVAVRAGRMAAAGAEQNKPWNFADLMYLNQASRTRAT